MIYLIVIVICVLIIFVPFIRIIVFNPFRTLYYTIIDIFKYILYRRYNIPKTGEMICFSAHFGGGKTLTSVDKLTHIYKRFNGKKYYDNGSWKTVCINILSNVELSVPFINLTSLSQVTSLFDTLKDNDSNYVLYNYIFIDEASVQLNSRNFKDNIDGLFLNSLLTCRHYHASLYYTSQKFKLTDALLRSVTQKVIQCRKIWRICLLNIYDADTVENHSDLKEIKPIKRTGYFVSNYKFKQYDTLACVDNLVRSSRNGDMLSSQDILDNISNSITNNNITIKSKKKFI